MNRRSKLLFSIVSLPTLALGLFVATPSTAQAAEVQCSNEYGECTISNDGNSWISCSCGDNGGDEGTGGDEFAGLSEEELNEICLEHLAWCEPQAEDGGEGTSTSDSGEEGTGTSDSGEEETGTTFGEEGTGTTDSGEEGTTDPGEEGTSDSGEGEGEASTGDSSTGDSDDGTGDSGTGDSGEGEASTGDSAGDSGPGEGDSGEGSGSDSGGGSAGEGEGEGGSETGGDGGGAGDDGEGQGCTVNPHASGLGLLMFSMLGLLGLRRREEKA